MKRSFFETFPAFVRWIVVVDADACKVQIDSNLALSDRVSSSDIEGRLRAFHGDRVKRKALLPWARSIPILSHAAPPPEPIRAPHHNVLFALIPRDHFSNIRNRKREPIAENTHQAALWLPRHSHPSSACRASCAMPSTAWSHWIRNHCVTNSRPKQVSLSRRRPP